METLPNTDFQSHMMRDLVDMILLFLLQDCYLDPRHLELPTTVLDFELHIYSVPGIH